MGQGSQVSPCIKIIIDHPIDFTKIMTNDNDYMWGPNYDINFNDNDVDDDNDGLVVDDPPIWPGGNHADSRAFSTCAENTRRIRVSATHTFRTFSAHLKIKRMIHFFNFSFLPDSPL